MKDPSSAIAYGLNPLDRRSEKRDDRALHADALAHPGARVLVLAGERLVMDPEPEMQLAGARSLGVDLDAALLLGWRPDGRPLFAAAAAVEPAGAELVDLRTLALDGRLPEETLGPVAQARSMLGWHERHRFCANCGTSTAIAMGGYRRDCAACGAQHFPRVDPVAIMLVSRGDRALLGRQARFKPGSYSCLAGFVEPGETLEDAVRRETFEEAGIKVGRVSYHASQPWPFVSSLMLGCLGEAVSEEVVMDEAELEDCRWFPRSEVASMVDGTHPGGLTVPPLIAIARHLIDHWLRGG